MAKAMQLLVGEQERRLGHFDEAHAHFTEMKRQPDSQSEIIKSIYQLDSSDDNGRRKCGEGETLKFYFAAQFIFAFLR